MYTLKSSTTKVALQHMSKKTLYQLNTPDVEYQLKVVDAS